MRALPLLTLALLAACDSPGNQGQPANAAENSVGKDGPANALDANVLGNAAPAVSLSGYVGKYPPDLVDGAPFLNNPAVVAAVDATLKDKVVRGWIFDKAGPQTPITERDGKLLSFGCETHNCGPHNWTVAITPDGKAADICYYDEAKSDKATWWLADGRTQQRPGGCPSGDEG